MKTQRQIVVKFAPRVLSAEQMRTILTALKGKQAPEVDVRTVSGDKEPVDFGRQLVQVLREASGSKIGFAPEAFMAYDALPGVVVLAPKENAYAIDLYHALRAAGVRVDYQPDKQLKPAAIQVNVGRKP